MSIAGDNRKYIIHETLVASARAIPPLRCSLPVPVTLTVTAHGEMEI